MSGWVSTVSASSTTSEELSQSVVDDYTVTLADYYGVLEEEINVVTTYEATGSMSVTIPDDVNEEALVDAITDSIATSLGVHPQNVGVTVDMQTGDVEFSVTSNSFNEAAGNQFDLDNEQYQNSIVSSIESTVPSVTVDSYEVANDVTATLEFTVDADAATNDLTQAAWQSEQLLLDLMSPLKTQYVTEAPTLIPSVRPTTSLPTEAPSLTGSVAVIELSKPVSETIPTEEVADITKKKKYRLRGRSSETAKAHRG
eukprot:TRINITY_DN547_c0_g1_i2.p1 TRINITY_DN547_c0_g1~~TRINITY_DN547_c0_g1_i2.p1  ORF type:complete len:256 (-),score=62.84 TRINITY_DN547_c0_g1_i2:2-769(-)